MSAGRTPFSWNDFIPNRWHWREYAWRQSMNDSSTALISCLEFLLTVASILWSSLTKYCWIEVFFLLPYCEGSNRASISLMTISAITASCILFKFGRFVIGLRRSIVSGGNTLAMGVMVSCLYILAHFPDSMLSLVN